MRCKRFIDRIHIGRRPHHNRDVGQVAGHLVQQAFAVMYRQVQRHALMAARKFHQQAREEVIAGADNGHVQFAAGDALELGHRVFGFLELLDDGAAVVQ
ncbi:hypothetical protein D3C81_1934010 [compost metagenome]